MSPQQSKMIEYRINKQAMEFLLYAYFGIVTKDYSSEVLQDCREIAICKCVRRAYLDMNRTLELNPNSGNAFYEKYGPTLATVLSAENRSISDLKADAYKVFFDGVKLKDDVANHLALKTFKDAKKRQDSPFYFGQAQKWINMSLKYMWLIGLIDDCHGLEVPLDRNIMQIASDQCGILFPRDNDKPGWFEYNENTSMPWSKMNSFEYNCIQQQLGKSISTEEYSAPILWECDKWIEQAELKKGTTKQSQINRLI